MLGERRSNSLFAPAAPAEPERKPEQAEVHDISFEERTGRSLFAEASTAPRASELFFAPQEKGVTFAEALSQVQSYLSETYATLITEDNSDAKEQMKRRMARYLQENRIAVDGMTASELVDALYTEMAEYGFLTKYIHFTEEQKQRAAAVNLEEFLRCRGEKLLSSGREKRLASDHSVTVRGNEWYDHAEERGGHAVSFVQRFYGLSYPDAVTMLLGGELGTAYPSAGERTEEPVKPFALPPANKDMRRVFAYLIKHRSIARDVVARFAKAGLLYEDAEYHNAVFVGTDTDGVPRHAHKRSANSYGKAFRLNVEGSDPRYSFQLLMGKLPPDHKARWFAGAALNSAEQAMASVMSTVLSRLNAFLDSELEQVLCFDSVIDAEKFASEKSAYSSGGGHHQKLHGGLDDSKSEP